MSQWFLQSAPAVWVSQMWNHPKPVEEGNESWIDRHFIEVAFAVSTLALFILSPLSLFLGGVAGFALHYSIEPNLEVKAEERLIGQNETVIALVGGFASLIHLTPSGAAGGIVFQAIPLMASLAVGSIAYRAWRKQTS